SLWNSANWQPSTTHVKPDFLLNYDGNAGYWEIQGYSFEDVTEVLKAQAAADAALAKYETLAADGVLDRGEKSSQLIPLWNDESAAWTALRARAVALGLDVSPYDGPYYAASNYLSGLYPYWNDVTNDTQIVRSDFNTIFNNLSQARSGMQSTIAAKAATMASG